MREKMYKKQNLTSDKIWDMCNKCTTHDVKKKRAKKNRHKAKDECKKIIDERN